MCLAVARAELSAEATKESARHLKDDEEGAEAERRQNQKPDDRSWRHVQPSRRMNHATGAAAMESSHETPLKTEYHVDPNGDKEKGRNIPLIWVEIAADGAPHGAPSECALTARSPLRIRRTPRGSVYEPAPEQSRQ